MKTLIKNTWESCDEGMKNTLIIGGIYTILFLSGWVTIVSELIIFKRGVNDFPVFLLIYPITGAFALIAFGFIAAILGGVAWFFFCLGVFVKKLWN